MTENRPRSLGDYFAALAAPDAERARLASLAKDGGLPARIIKKYVTRTPLYKTGFSKHERIRGARAGTTFYREQSFKMIIAALGAPRNKRNEQYWRLYQDSAVEYVRHDLRELYKLLFESQLPDGVQSPSEALRSACKLAHEFDVTQEQVAAFYDAWWMSRIDDFETCLPLWMKVDEASVQRKQLTQLAAQLEALRLTVAERDTAADQQRGTMNVHQGEINRLNERQLLLERDVGSLSARLSALADSVTKSEVSDRLAAQLSSFGSRVHRLEELEKARGDQVSPDELRKALEDLRRQTRASIEELDRVHTHKISEGISAATSSFAQRVTALIGDAERQRAEASSATSSSVDRCGPYKSPLLKILERPPNTYKLSSELDFINAWQHHLIHTKDVALTFEQAAAFHRALLGNSVVVCDRTMALSWIECMSWQSFTLHLAASPTWSCEEDWAPGAEHLFLREGSPAPRLVVIHNYDLGLPDCYLGPTLALWALRRQFSPTTKLFLVPARDSHTPPACILEHALCLVDIEYITAQPFTLREEVRVPPPLHRVSAVGADPKIVEQWAPSRVSATDEILSLQRALKCRFPAELRTGFERTTSFLGRFFDQPTAVAIAMHHQVVPWFRTVHGEAKARDLVNIAEMLTERVGA